MRVLGPAVRLIQSHIATKIHFHVQGYEQSATDTQFGTDSRCDAHLSSLRCMPLCTIRKPRDCRRVTTYVAHDRFDVVRVNRIISNVLGGRFALGEAILVEDPAAAIPLDGALVLCSRCHSAACEAQLNELADFGEHGESLRDGVFKRLSAQAQELSNW